MRASKEQLETWKKVLEVFSVSEIKNQSKLNRATVQRVLDGDNVHLCNFHKVHKVMISLVKKVKRIKTTGDE